MVERQSCSGLVSASASSAVERELKLKVEILGDMDEVLAELQRERQRNAELLERISVLEAQIQEREKGPPLVKGELLDNCSKVAERSIEWFKRQKTEQCVGKVEHENVRGSVQSAAEMQHAAELMPTKVTKLESQLVNWMSMEESHFLHLDKSKDGESIVDYDHDTDDSDDNEDRYPEEDEQPGFKHMEHDEISRASSVKEDVQEDFHEGMHFKAFRPHLDNHSNAKVAAMSQKAKDESSKDESSPEEQFLNSNKAHERITSLQERPPKVAFCPKEVKRILESEALFSRNAQSHTIQKIIVFASLGIRHGCEDMYELDYNHFTILRKGDSCVSPNEPEEYVLYENPGVRRKIFYPNPSNPRLCPVRILQEERDMRPSDGSCPSSLFLCIKYGGRTRNLPQNEYVRQRMGPNKLKSFGPLICQMAGLINLRTGSFFFKALGITLLFMAGFPDNLVQRETKYRNLDLLQKYYRKDEDAEGEELFHTHSMTCNIAISSPQQATSKPTSVKPKGKKQTNTSNKPDVQKTPQNPVPPTQFSLMGYASIQAQAMSTFTPLSQIPVENPAMSNPLIPRSHQNFSYRNHHAPYPIFPHQAANALFPVWYWAPPYNAYPVCQHPSSLSYHSLPATGNYISFHQQLYDGRASFSHQLPKPVQGAEGANPSLYKADTDSEGHSSSTVPK